MAKTKEGFVKFNTQTNELICQGEWILANVPSITDEYEKISLPRKANIILNGQAISKMDSAGAWLLLRFSKKNNTPVSFKDFSKQHKDLLSIVEEKSPPSGKIPKIIIPNWITNVGIHAVQAYKEGSLYLNFIGKLSFEWLRIISRPSSIRWQSFASVIERNGCHALPIIALMSLMIGIVISYQMGDQLRKYGANVFIVDLLGYSILREFGPLLAAIMVAGRTGSAFAAQLGIMKIKQEIDALNVMGITPGELLILPRITALFIIMPLLTIWADFFGIVGGMIMANNLLNVGWHDFLMRFQEQIPVKSLLIGLGKAPVFALLISSISCFQGMQVKRDAVSVGSKTTRSVVLSIFFIIMADAAFSIALSELKI